VANVPNLTKIPLFPIENKKMTQKTPKNQQNNKYYCFNCGMTYQINDDSGKKKLCPRCKGRVGKIIG